ncbi:hypothetical protein [Streptomyces sp. NPDC005969]
MAVQVIRSDLGSADQAEGHDAAASGALQMFVAASVTILPSTATTIR